MVDKKTKESSKDLRIILPDCSNAENEVISITMPPKSLLLPTDAV